MGTRGGRERMENVSFHFQDPPSVELSRRDIKRARGKGAHSSERPRIGRECENAVWDAACITCYPVSRVRLRLARQMAPSSELRASLSLVRHVGCALLSDLLLQLSLVGPRFLSFSVAVCWELKPDAATLYPWRVCTLCGDMHTRYFLVAEKKGQAVRQLTSQQKLERHLSALIPPPLPASNLRRSGQNEPLCSRYGVVSAGIGATADGLVARQTEGQTIAGCEALLLKGCARPQPQEGGWALTMLICPEDWRSTVRRK